MNRFIRSKNNRMITGVVGGLADKIGLDANILRIIVLAAGLLTPWGAAIAAIYVVLSVMAPEGFTSSSHPFGSSFQSGARSFMGADDKTRKRNTNVLIGGLLILFGLWYFLRQFMLRTQVGSFVRQYFSALTSSLQEVSRVAMQYVPLAFAIALILLGVYVLLQNRKK